jgi:hypothetical protein
VFNRGKPNVEDDLSLPGKLMAYIAKGTVREELFGCFDKVHALRLRALL